MRLYVATKTQSASFKLLVEYVVKVYAPVWFRIKQNSSCVNGSSNLTELFRLSRYLNDDMKRIIDPIVQRNVYFGHPENILIAMLTKEKLLENLQFVEF